MNKNPVVGMKDIMPNEMEIRQFLLAKIRDTYKKFGFTEIATPTMEHIENLNGDLGWENEKLIFKVLKRGDKLKEAFDNGSLQDMIDFGLRYDLTLPLSRFYASNKDSLPKPFKSIQIGSVFRADRPQKGRYREFTQCDIDVFGDDSFLSEIECLTATATFLNEIKLDKYGISIDINDRRILKYIILSSGFSENDIKDICIILDKEDKIGLDGVKQNLIDDGYDQNKTNALYDNINNLSKNGLSSIKELIVDDKDVIKNLNYIIDTVSNIANIKVNFKPTLVRGMGYYTGPIFEIKCDAFNSSIGGGGRYDDMIGEFLGEKIPACGISIGFERLITILMDDNYVIDEKKEKIAYLIDKNIDDNKKKDILIEAYKERQKGNIVYIANMAKNIKFQKENLANNGFTKFVDFK